MQKRFGALPEWEYQSKTDMLYDFVSQAYEGIMGLGYGDVPPECIEFCLSQYERFGVPVPPELEDVVKIAASQTLISIDADDPYMLFTGISDVNITSEWAEHAYEIIEDAYKVVEADPNHVETFVFVPGQAEESFNSILSHPGLDALPCGAADPIRDRLYGHGMYSCEPCMDHVYHESKEYLYEFCKDINGRVDDTRFNAYLELAAWAAFAWIIGPLSRKYRMINHDIIGTAIAHGEAILYDGCIFSPQNYRKLPRPPLSCYKCGVASWCVEITMVSGDFRHICENCLSEGMPRMPLTTCGTKFCMLAECPHHPYHHLGAQGIHRTMREYGQLGSMARGESILRVKNDNKLLLRG